MIDTAAKGTRAQVMSKKLKWPEDFIDKIICGDCLEAMKEMPDNCMNLVYADPPFFTQSMREAVKKWSDVWISLEQYIHWMKIRVEEIHRILTKDGSFYLHCDWHAGHYLKVMLDEVFGYRNFRNEIVWHYRTGNIAKKQFQRKHDAIFFYTKSDKWIFNSQEIKEYYSEIYGPSFKPSFTGRKSGSDKYGDYRISFIDDVWNLSAVFTLSKEHTGYPTQKPKALLERIIKASSRKDDLVLDPFVGSGTTAVACLQTSRHCVGIDNNPDAIKMAEERLAQEIL